MRLNGAAFYYDYNDYQAFKQINLDAQVVNKDARTWGIELETTIKPDENWTESERKELAAMAVPNSKKMEI